MYESYFNLSLWNYFFFLQKVAIINFSELKSVQNKKPARFDIFNKCSHYLKKKKKKKQKTLYCEGLLGGS